MKDFIKKEEPEFEREDAHVLDDDAPDGDLPELPQIAARKRKTVTKRGKGRKTRRKSKKTKTGTRRKKTTKRKRRSTKASASGGEKIGRVRRVRREKEPKLQIRQNDDVIVLDEEDLTDKAPTPPPQRAKPTPPNILDQIMFAQEKEFGVVKPGAASKGKIPPTGRRSVWNK